MGINWREVQGKYGMMYFCNADDFLKATESEVPVEIRRTFENYTKTKAVANMEKKDGRYKTDWIVDDVSSKKRYKATYDDQWGWGVMATELSDKQIAAIKSKQEGEGQTQLPGGGAPAPAPASSNIEAAINLTNEHLKNMNGLLEQMRQYLEVIAGEKAGQGFHTADKELAAAEEADFNAEELGNEE